MFSSTVTAIPNYLIMAKLHWIDTYLAVIVPAFQSSLGLYLIRQFMENGIPDSVIEAARIDGAGEFTIYRRIVMPMVKPAWLTLVILSVQSLWNVTGGSYIYSEQLKPLTVALNQLMQGFLGLMYLSSKFRRVTLPLGITYELNMNVVNAIKMCIRDRI